MGFPFFVIFIKKKDMKKIIRLTESDFKKLIRESVNRVLNDYEFDPDFEVERYRQEDDYINNDGGDIFQISDITEIDPEYYMGPSDDELPNY